jgi:CubicO group peptidase (beta-lactamase class C family)
MSRPYFALRTALIAAAFAIGMPAASMAKDKPVSYDLVAPVAPQTVGFDAQRLERLDSAMAKVVKDGRVAGMTTLLVRHGKIVQFKTYGQASIAPARPMTKDTIVRIYSMTKPITGVAMMMLFEEGKWNLDDPVSKYIPELANLTVFSGVDDKGQITTVPVKRSPTMRELMSHTAGFGYGLEYTNPVDKQFRDKMVLASPSLQEAVNRVATIPLKFQPGTEWAYSISVDLQGYIVEKLSGQTLGAFMKSRIFDPLKMKDTAFSTGPEKAARLASLYMGDPKTGKLFEAKAILGNTLPDYIKPPLMESGGGGLVSTTSDYGRFAQMILNKGELDGVRLLSPATVELMGTNVIPKDVLVSSNGSTVARFNEAVGFGLDFMVMNEPRRAGSLVGKGTMSWGGAAGTWCWIDPANDLYFVGMIQRMGGTGGGDLGTLARTLTYQALTEPSK